MTCAPTFRHSRLRHLLVTASLMVAASAWAVTPAGAQFIATASLEGAVTDPSGGALPGVVVTLSSPALQVAQMTDVTNPEGHYRFTQLPVGVYQVKYELSGFQTTVRDSLQIGSGFAATRITTISCATDAGSSRRSKQPRSKPGSRASHGGVRSR